MSYQAQAQLEADYWFQQRSRACCVQQAETFKDDARADIVAVAEAVLTGSAEVYDAFIRLNAGGPGIADKADNADGTIDSDKVTDADLLSLTQAGWPVVAGLYFAADGTPK